MKVGLVVDDGLDRPDGVQQYILSLGAQLKRLGHEVVYLAGETRNAPKGVMVYSLSKNIKVSFNGNNLSVPLPASSRKIKKILKKENFDVLHVQIPHSPFMGAKVVRSALPGTAIVGTFHILPFGGLSRLGTGLLGLVLKPNLGRFHKFIAVSQPAAVFASESFRISSQVIPNMVDIKQFKGKGRAKNPVPRLLFVGRLVERKGCRQLLKAVSILKTAGNLPTGARVDICGDGPLRSELEHYALTHDLSENVKFHGFISNDEKIRFMRQADISIFPSLAGESFGIVLIEAMSAGGGVVLGGSNPGYASVLADAPESLIDADNENKFATGLGVLLADKNMLERLYGAQQAHVTQFDSAVVTRRIISVYQACINQANNK